MATPATMKALVYHGPGRLVVEERPTPAPGADEVQIAVKSVSICGSDLGAYRHASDRFRPPLVLGHEFSGLVTGIGGKVRNVKVGDRVSVNPMLYCGECYHCLRGENNLCGHRRSLGTAIGGVQTDGAMREYVTVRSGAVVPLRDELGYRDGAMLEPMAVCLACAKCGRVADEENVLVVGAGPIGLLTVKFLKTMGVRNVMVSDVMNSRLAKALECGATHALNPGDVDLADAVAQLTGGVGADRVIIAAGVGRSINDALAMVRSGGVVVLVALMHENVEIDPMHIVGRGVKFFGSYMFTGEMGECVDLLAEGKIGVDDLVTSHFALEDGKAAFDLLCRPGNDEIKVQLSLNARL